LNVEPLDQLNDNKGGAAHKLVRSVVKRDLSHQPSDLKFSEEECPADEKEPILDILKTIINAGDIN
jgi:hypothetical protein